MVNYTKTKGKERGTLLSQVFPEDGGNGMQLETLSAAERQDRLCCLSKDQTFV
jgi:hypothetical protein